MQKYNWFPGHMRKTMIDLKDKLKVSNFVIQVVDARLPFTSWNRELLKMANNKEIILVFNKIDLISIKQKRFIENDLMADLMKSNIKNYIFLSKHLEQSKRILHNSVLEMAKNKFKTTYSIATIIGLPNIGKSTIINSLKQSFYYRNSGKTRSNALVAPVACFTKSVHPFIISDSPKIALFDTPGVFSNKGINLSGALKLSLINSINERNAFFKPEILTKFLLSVLNKLNHFKYLKFTGANRPIQNFEELVVKGRNKHRVSERIFCEWFVREFRTGSFGHVLLDDQKIDQIVQDENFSL